MSSSRNAADRPIFVGNFEYDASVREVERLFERFGKLDRVEMKTGFAFIYIKDKRDGDDAIRYLDGREFGNRRRRLKVEWAKGDGEIKRREDRRRANIAPTCTLFVVNFDLDRTRERDLEDHFEPFGRLKRVQIKRNYAFVEYEQLDQAIEAVKHCHLSRLLGRSITVEYVAKEADGRSGGGGGGGGGRDNYRGRSESPPRRGRSRSPSYGGRRSPTPRSRRRGRSRSPCYGGRRSPTSRSRSPSYSRSPARSPVRSRSRT